MRVAVLSSGAIVVDNWLFGAPFNIKEQLKELDITPQVVFTTSLRSPGVGSLGPILSFKEMPLSMNGKRAIPILKKHGTDYSIESTDGKILFSERGDVSTEDTEGYQLAIIKNKHRADNLGSHVITWPWSDSEYLIREGVVTPLETTLKVWSDIEDIPPALKGLGVTLEQANQIARIAEASGSEGKENWAIAISTFKKGHIKKDGHWVKREKEEMMKVSKEEANYREGLGDKICKNCHHYLEDGSCMKVEGDISPNMTSDYFSPKEDHMMEMKEGSLIEKIIAAGGKEDEIRFIYRSKNDNSSYYVDFGDWATEETIKAVKKVLGNKVEYEAEVPPPNKENWVVIKEWVEGVGPVRNFGDTLVADLHKAYNDCSDHYFKMGYMNEEERISIASAIGDALKALRNSAPKEVMERSIGETIPMQLKELVPNAPDKIEGYWLTVYKTAEGEERWASISSVAVKDRQEETFSTKAMDWALGFAKIVQFKGPLRYRHIPGLDGGDCDTQLRIGDFLFEAGTFRDNAIGQRLKELMKVKGMGVSLGLLFAKEDIVDGIYQRALIFERSLTPVPAVPYTSIIIKGKQIEMNKLTEEQLVQLAQELNMDVTEVKTMYDRAIQAGGPLGLKELETALKESMGGAAVTAHDEEEEKETKLSRKDMLEILEGLTVAEFKDLEKMMAQVKAKSPEEEPEENLEEDEEYKPMPMAKKKKEVDPILVAIKQQNETLATLVQVMASQQGNNVDVEKAIQKVLGQAPRGQTQFVTKSAPSNGEETPAIDKTVASRLKEIEDKLAAQSQIPDIRDVFTSKTLNQ